MTTSNAIASQSIGTSTNVGAGKFPQKITLTTGTTAFVVEGRITNGAASYRKDPVRVYFAISSFSVTAAAAVDLLRSSAMYVDIMPSENGGVARSRMSLLTPAAGAYLYLWCDIPVQVVAQTLDVNTTELP